MQLIQLLLLITMPSTVYPLMASEIDMDVFAINTPKQIIQPWHTAFPKWRPLLFQSDRILGIFTLFYILILKIFLLLFARVIV